MKKTFLVSFLLLLCFGVHAQDQSPKNSWAISLDFKMGNGILDSEKYNNLNGNTEEATFEISYNFPLNENWWSHWRIGLGAKTGTYRANVFPDSEQASLLLEYFQFPLTLSTVIRLSKNETSPLNDVKFIAGIGSLMNLIYNYELNFTDHSKDLGDPDINFGILFNLSFEYDVTRKFSIATGLEISSTSNKDSNNQEVNITSYGLYLGAAYRF